MRISDWSSDVCSSDLNAGDSGRTLIKLPEVVANRASEAPSISADGNLLIYRDRSPISKSQDLVPLYRPTATDTDIDTIRVYERKIGRASCRERVCQYV